MRRGQFTYSPTDAIIHHLGQRLIALQIALRQTVGAVGASSRLGTTFRIGASPLGSLVISENIKGIQQAIYDAQAQIAAITGGPGPVGAPPQDVHNPFEP